MIHFTGDTHFGHGNIIWYCKRPFANQALIELKVEFDRAKKANASNFNTLKAEYFAQLAKAVDRMDETLVDKWNKKVDVTDTVYHVGDVLFHTPEKAVRLLDRLNGKKILIFGNHDKTIKQSAEVRAKFERCYDYHELKVGDQMIVLSHYAHLVWNKSHHGSWMLHGHSHGGLVYPFESKMIDVGCDAHQYAPISYDEVKKIMDTRPIQKVDHHE